MLKILQSIVFVSTVMITLYGLQLLENCMVDQGIIITHE